MDAMVLAAAALAIAPPGQLGWLEGGWCTDGGEPRTCEYWSPEAGGTMLGVSQTVKAGRTSAFEFLRIVREGDGLAYFGSPEGRPAVRFGQGERSGERADDQRIAFVNAGHDYPQRITYWREGKALIAEISLADGSKARRWRYSSVIKD